MFFVTKHRRKVSVDAHLKQMGGIMCAVCEDNHVHSDPGINPAPVKIVQTGRLGSTP